ncbi:hypothetical protein PFISCL1PPCAC_21309, partial [Pristionchus fissidentatus]
AVLGAVVDSNFGSASHSRIDDLYTAISELPVALFDSSSSTAFVHFARAFAVVMEESCMQRMEKQPQSCVENREPITVKPLPMRTTIPTSSTVALSTVSTGGLVSKGKQQQATSTSAASATGGRSSGASQPRKDTSSDAVKGALVVHSIDSRVTRAELIQFLQKVGPLKELAFPLFKDKSPYPYGACKYENESSSARAIRELHGARLKGRPLTVFQARHWVDNEAYRVTTREQQGDVSESAPSPLHHLPTPL